MNFNFPNNLNSGPITDNHDNHDDRRDDRFRLNGLREGDPILVQTPAGISVRGVFLRIDDGFLIWVRILEGAAFITISSLDEITITKL